MQGSAGTTEYVAPPGRRVQKQRGSKTPNSTSAGRVSRENGRPRNREIDEIYRSLIAAPAGGRAAVRENNYFTRSEANRKKHKLQFHMYCRLARCSKTSAVQGHSARRRRATPRACARGWTQRRPENETRGESERQSKLEGPRSNVNRSRSEAETMGGTSLPRAELSAFTKDFSISCSYSIARKSTNYLIPGIFCSG